MKLDKKREEDKENVRHQIIILLKNNNWQKKEKKQRSRRIYLQTIMKNQNKNGTEEIRRKKEKCKNLSTSISFYK